MAYDAGSGTGRSGPARHESYEATQFLTDVVQMLAQGGLHPVVSTTVLRETVSTCGSLLCLLGIVPEYPAGYVTRRDGDDQ